MENSRVWVFQALRDFTEEEKGYISERLSSFMSCWEAHGASLESTFDIVEDRFIAVYVNEANTSATGCSIDAMTREIKNIENKYSLGLLDRTLVSFDRGNGIEVLALPKFKEELKSNSITPTAQIYNMSVSDKKEFDTSFKIQIQESWAKMYLQ